MGDSGEKNPPKDGITGAERKVGCRSSGFCEENGAESTRLSLRRALESIAVRTGEAAGGHPCKALSLGSHPLEASFSSLPHLFFLHSASLFASVKCLAVTQEELLGKEWRRRLLLAFPITWRKLAGLSTVCPMV